MSENYHEMKLWRRFKIFENLYQELETVNFGGPWPLTFESHNAYSVIFSIFGKVTSIPEKLGLFTNVVWK